MNIQKIERADLPLLSLFISRLGGGRASFRYFDKRPPDIVLNHEVALLMMDEHEPVAYGHLEREDDNVWLGVAVVQEYIGRGYGKQMVQTLLDYASASNIPNVILTVDKTNIVATRLYEKLGFVFALDGGNYWQYSYKVK